MKSITRRSFGQTVAGATAAAFASAHFPQFAFAQEAKALKFPGTVLT